MSFIFYYNEFLYFLVFDNLCNQKFPLNFVISNDFREFCFLENNANEVPNEEFMISNDFREFCFIENNSNEVPNEEFAIQECNFEEVETSNVSSNEDNLKIFMDSLNEPLKIYKQIQSQHDNEICQLKEEILNLRTKCKSLEEEKNELSIELKNVKNSMKQFVSSLM